MSLDHRQIGLRAIEAAYAEKDADHAELLFDAAEAILILNGEAREMQRLISSKELAIKTWRDAYQAAVRGDL